MEKRINPAYILTPCELMVIAAGKNLHQMFHMEKEPLQVDESIVFQALSSLYQQGIIRNSEQEGFLLEEDLEQLIGALSQAHTVVLVRSFKQGGGSKIIYVGSRLVVTEQSSADDNAIRIYELPTKELRDVFKEEWTREEKQYKQILDEERLIQEAMESPSVLQNEMLDSLANVIILVEKINQKKNKVDCRMLVKQEEEKKRQIYYEDGKPQIYDFEENVFIDKVVTMIEEVFYDIG